MTEKATSSSEFSAVQGTEEAFLKLVKIVILLFMGLALLATPLFLIYGAANYFTEPKEPEPIKSAPAKEVTTQGLAEAFIQLQKQQDEAVKADGRRKASEQDKPEAIYLEDATKLFRCAEGFAKAVEAELNPNRDATAEIEERRRYIEQQAGNPTRGDAYVASLVKFMCTALADPKIIEIKKTNVYKGSIIFPAIRFHTNQWDRNVRDRQTFDASERDRYARQQASEAARVATDRAQAIAGFTAAASAFAAFMALAIYLILAKIETNLRDISAPSKASALAHESA